MKQRKPSAWLIYGKMLRHVTPSDWLVIILVVVVLLLLWSRLASPQPAAPTCDESLVAQYRQLVGDKLVPEQPGAPAWSQQLVTLVTQLRTGKTLLDIKKQQADLAEQNVAQLLEQLRQAQVQNGDLRREVEALKQGSKPPGN